MFTREDGAPIGDPRDDWYKLCVEAGFGGYVEAKRKNGKKYQKYVGLQPHDFRRTAVRNLIRSGVPQHTAMRISGHKTEDVFRRYDIVDEADLIDATRKLEGQVKPQASRDLTARCWSGWKQALLVVTPETVVRWHRAGFRWYWRVISKVRKPVGRKPT